jgi:DNA-binding XRE family transcriptional regulator
MTQEGVARAIDVPLSVYRSWERERATPRGAAFYRLCVLFDWPHRLRPSLEVTEPNLCLAQLALTRPFRS